MTVEIDGNAQILGYGNGDSSFQEIERPTDPHARSFDIRTFNGLAQVIIKSSDGDFDLKIGGNELQGYPAE